MIHGAKIRTGFYTDSGEPDDESRSRAPAPLRLKGDANLAQGLSAAQTVSH
jgi:hypothetical protein